jgi:trk system potassium uptake protein
MKRFVVIGLGNFGAAVAESLHSLGYEVVAVDASESAVDRLSGTVSRAVLCDGRNVKLLERAGAKQADGGVVATGTDITASILATMALRDLGVKEIYVKVVSKDHARILEKIGVTETVFPERESGIRLAKRMMSTRILNHVSLGRGFSVREIAVPDGWIGQTLRQLALPATYRVSVIAVHDVLRDEIIPVPDADAALSESDTLLIAGTDDDLERAVQATA